MRKLSLAMSEKLIGTAIRSSKQGVVRSVSRARRAKDAEEEARQHTVLRSSIVKVIPQTDMDKKLFLGELLKMMGYAEMYYNSRQYVAFYNVGLTIAFTAVQVQHFVLADKVYSLFGFMLLTAQKYALALEMYRKLRNCAHTHRDIISKMFALK